MRMKKLFTLVAATALAVLSLVSNQAQASHAVAADITYTYVGPNQFLLTLRFYRDCAGISAPTTASISYTSSCFSGGSITLQQLPGTGQQIPPSPCLPTVVSSCNGGPGYGIQEYIYQGVVTLPGPCADWTFSYNLCCRNDLINTLVNPATFNLYVATTLDNFNFPTNSSPQFANIPVTQFCVNNTFYYSQLATDIDGDSLVFSLAPSETNANTPVTYAAPYGPLYPLASSTPVTIDPQTGTITFTPSLVQVGVLAVVVEEYRNGVKIGQIKRDMQMNVVSTCIGTAPTYAPPVDPNGNPSPYNYANCGDTQFFVVLNQPVQCGSVVNTDIRVLTPQNAPNPVMNVQPWNCQNGLTDSILVTVFTPLTAGITYVYTKVGFDNNTFLTECGVAMPEFDSIPYNVIDPGVFDLETVDVSCAFDEVTVTFDYEIMCNSISGCEFMLVDANGVTYPITSTNCPPGGSSYTNTLTFTVGSTITPASPVYLMVQNGSDQNTFTNRCLTFILPGDTLAEITVQPNLVVNIGPDITICSYDPLPVLDAGIPNATYEWFIDGVSTGVTTQTIQTTNPGVYTVQVNSVTNCSGNDNLTLNVIQAPVINLGSDTTLCLPDVIVLDAGNAGATSYQWFESGNAIAGATSQTYQPSQTGNYSVQVNTGGQCSATGDINVTIIQQLSVTVADVAICSNDQFPVLDAGVTGVNYSWTLNGTVVGNNQTYQPTQAGNYIVTVSVGNCTADDIFTVGVVDVPVVSLSNSNVCPGSNFPVLDAGNPGMQYQWSTGETTQTINPNAPGTYVVTVINGALGLSCTSTSQATFAFNAPVVVSLGNDVTVCDGTATQPVDAGNPGATYVWSLDGNTLSGQTGQTISVTDAGTYTVLVTDANGCTGTDDFVLTVNPLPQINLGDDLTFCSQDVLPVLNADINDPNATYSWTLNGNSAGSAATLQAPGFGTYTVLVVDGNNCETTDEVTLSEKPCEIEIPNVFTPGNGDGNNDFFVIKNLDSNPNTRVQILNRWGREVYSSSNYQNNWDGGDLPHGTYFYVVVVQTGKDYKGTLQLIRQK